MTVTSLADWLIMRNLTRFLWLGIARLMGKKTRKGDNTKSYPTEPFFVRAFRSNSRSATVALLPIFSPPFLGLFPGASGF